MKKNELKGVMDGIVAHFTGWLLLAPLAGFGFGGLLAVANWIGGFGFDIGKCYVAGWFAAGMLFSFEVFLTDPRQINIKHEHVMPSANFPGSMPHDLH